MIMNSVWIVFIFSLLMSGVHCEKRGRQPDLEAVVCEGETLKISCSGKQEIHISGAEYGRTEPGSKHCPSFFLLDINTACYSETALGITKEECDGFNSCTLYANNDEYGDPCFGTHKYLKVSYRCVPAKSGALQKIRVCEGQQASIDCPKRSSIVIKYANYGRLKGPHVCGVLIALTKNCAAESSFETVKRDCGGKDRCLLEANNVKFNVDGFGKDPCPLTPKYLEVRYKCK